MRRKFSSTKIIAAAVILSACLAAQGQQNHTNCYPDPPPALSDEVDKTVDRILQIGPDELLSRINTMVSLTVSDALGGDGAAVARKLEAYRYLGETARTDKQVGASATSSGSTSAVDKPGLISLLGFAVEHGAIQQDVSSTALTLTTSPYAIVALAKGDSPQTYQDYSLLNRLGVSATFDLTNQNNILANATRKQLTELTAKFRISGDRSTRSAGFQHFWDTEIAPAIKNRLNAKVDLTMPIVNDPQLAALVDPRSPASMAVALKSQIKTYLDSHKIDTDEKKASVTSALREMILCALKTSVYDRITSGTLSLSDNTKQQVAGALATLFAAEAQVAAAQVSLQQFLKTFMKTGNLLTLAYTDHRMVVSSNYSEVQFLFERHVAPIEIIANAGISFYDKPDPAKNQQTVRDYSGAVSFEGSSKSPFRSVSDDLSKVTYSLTARYERLKENENMIGLNPNVASAQAKVEIPIALGVSIPVSYTYSSATETSMKSENKFNIGLNFDIDKLYSVVKPGH